MDSNVNYFKKFASLADTLDEDYNVVQGLVNTDSDFKTAIAFSTSFELAMERHRIAEVIRGILQGEDLYE